MALYFEHPRYTVNGAPSVVHCMSASEWYAQYTAQFSNSTSAFASGKVLCNIGISPAAIPLQPVNDFLSMQLPVARTNDSLLKPMTTPIPQEPELHVAEFPEVQVSNQQFSQAIDRDAIQLVSLGCACGPKLAFKEMGRGAETLPFDWITTTSDGVLDFLRSGFQGFFDFERKVNKDVGGMDITAFRSRHHGFWHDDPTLRETHEKYNRRFARMLSINAHSQPVLFVRLAATSEEIRTVDKFMGHLTSQFGPRAYLLLIIDCQGANAPGPCTVKGLDNLLIHYLDGCSGITKFCGPVDTALDWAAQRQVQVLQVQDLEAASNLAKPVTPGYYGMGGMPAFEGVPEMF
jgi:hypothetical protein